MLNREIDKRFLSTSQECILIANKYGNVLNLINHQKY